eukprot:1835809-Pyramimonas_sp.AAC.1
MQQVFELAAKRSSTANGSARPTAAQQVGSATAAPPTAGSAPPSLIIFSRSSSASVISWRRSTPTALPLTMNACAAADRWSALGTIRAGLRGAQGSQGGPIVASPQSS